MTDLDDTITKVKVEVLKIPYPVTQIVILVDPCTPIGDKWTSEHTNSQALALLFNFQDENENAPIIWAEANSAKKDIFRFFCADFLRLWNFWENHS